MINDRRTPLKRRAALKKKAPLWKKRGNLKPGRVPMTMKCALCKQSFNKTDMRLHEPECRRINMIRIGARYPIMLNGKEVMVEIQAIHPDGSMTCLNLVTGRQCGVRSGRRFRTWMSKANISFKREAEAKPQRAGSSGEPPAKGSGFPEELQDQILQLPKLAGPPVPLKVGMRLYSKGLKAIFTIERIGKQSNGNPKYLLKSADGPSGMFTHQDVKRDMLPMPEPKRD